MILFIIATALGVAYLIEARRAEWDSERRFGRSSPAASKTSSQPLPKSKSVRPPNPVRPACGVRMRMSSYRDIDARARARIIRRLNRLIDDVPTERLSDLADSVLDLVPRSDDQYSPLSYTIIGAAELARHRRARTMFDRIDPIKTTKQ